LATCLISLSSLKTNLVSATAGYSAPSEMASANSGRPIDALNPVLPSCLT